MCVPVMSTANDYKPHVEKHYGIAMMDQPLQDGEGVCDCINAGCKEVQLLIELQVNVLCYSYYQNCVRMVLYRLI